MIRIGQVGNGLDGVGLYPEFITDWSGSGQQIEFTGLVHVPDDLATINKTAIASAIRQQLLNYKANPDEPMVPIVWDKDPSSSGFYQIQDVKVSWVPHQSLPRGIFPFSMSAFRTSTIRPALELEMTGDVLNNDHGLATPTVYPWAAYPASAQQPEFSDGSVITYRNSESGTMYIVSGNFWNRALYYHIDPEDHYDGACMIESAISPTGCDIELEEAVMVTTGTLWEHHPDNWRISNGLIRVYPTFSDVSDSSLFAVQAFDGSSWSVAKRFRLTGTSEYGLVTGIDHITILRNSPELVSIKLGITTTSNPRGGNLGRKQLSMTLLRGSLMVNCHLGTDDPADTWSIRREHPEASTALTAGIRATNADDSGHRYVLSTPQTSTNDLTNGGRTVSSPTKTFGFGIGSEIFADFAGAYNDAQNLIYQFHAAMTGKMMLSGRKFGT